MGQARVSDSGPAQLDGSPASNRPSHRGTTVDGPAGEARPCRACGALARPIRWEDGYIEVHCHECGSVSFHGQRSDHTGWYRDLYEPGGEEQLPAMLGRLRVRALGGLPLGLAPPPRLRTSDRIVLAEATTVTDPGEVVFDWGCGSGRLLQHLHSRGRRVLGIDVSPDLVRGLEAAGFSAVVSSDAELPWDGPDPRAIVMAELLEHLDDAAGLLTDIRRRFPEASLVVSVPSPRRLAAVSDSLEWWDRPPEHLARFSVEGLRRLFSRCGYRAEVHLPAPTGQDFVPDWYKRAARVAVEAIDGIERSGVRLDRSRVLAGIALWVHALYVRLGQAIGRLTPSFRRAVRATASAESMVGVAHPRTG